MITIDPLLRPTNAAEMIGVAPKTLDEWRLHGLGPAFLRVKTTKAPDSSIRYRVSDLRAFIDDLTIPEARRAKALREKRAKMKAIAAPAPAVDFEEDAETPAAPSYDKRRTRIVKVSLGLGLYDRAKATADRLGIPIGEYIVRCLEAFR